MNNLYTEEINEPVKEYGSRLKDEFREKAAETFERLFQQSGVDAEANAITAAKIHKLEEQISNISSTLSVLNFFRGMFIVIAIAGGIIFVLFLLHRIWYSFPEFVTSILWGLGGLFAAILSLVLVFAVFNGKIANVNKLLEEKRNMLSQEMAEAYKQMAPLNQLFQWDTVTKIITEVCPMLTFDKFFSQARMQELIEHFCWRPSVSDKHSILFCHSGAINGNAWVMAESLNFYWGSKTYTGTLDIEWEERESYYDSNGKKCYRWVTKRQTLRASVNKPFPEYYREKFLLYGNGAAPDLVFGRKPSGLADCGNGFFDKHKLKSAIKNLEKMTNDLKTDFTIMSNEEFDATFAALDRNNEHQFRLLFTPLAQQEMLNLLRDREQGFGDDFLFRKTYMINMLIPKHLENVDITASPTIFQHYELAESRRIFNEYSNDFFHHIFFAFAPLLAIPLYQQNESDHDIFKDEFAYTASVWEHEAVANSYNQDKFRHRDSVTLNIMKTEAAKCADGSTQLRVTAHGYREESRTDYVSVYGNDGHWHDVPVPWLEYIHVQHTSPLIMRETAGLDSNECGEEVSKFTTCKPNQDGIKYLKSILSFIPQK